VQSGSQSDRNAAYERLVESVAEMVLDRLKEVESGVVILVPRGCWRENIVKLLLELDECVFSGVFVYKGFKGKGKVKGVEQRVEEYEGLNDLVGKLRGRERERLAVVPESSCEAVELKRKLEQEAPGARVVLIYLPRLYEEAAKRLGWCFSGEVLELAKVEHGRLKEEFEVEEAAGLSPELLMERSEGGLEELRRGKDAVLALSLGKLGLIDYAREAADEAASAIAAEPIKAAVARSAAPFLLVAGGLLERIAPGLGLGAIASSTLIGVIGVSTAQLGNLLTRVVKRKWSKPEAKNKPVEVVVKLVEAGKVAREAAGYLDREELEAVVDQVALEWGLGVKEFKLTARNLAKLAESELATRMGLDELRMGVERVIGEIGSELERQASELERLNEEVEGLRIGVELFHLDKLEEGSHRLCFRVEGGRPKVLGGEGGAELVVAGRFGELAEEVLKKLEGGFLVLKGPKGVGKSTLALYCAWLALRREAVGAILYTSRLAGSLLDLMDLVRIAGGGKFLVLYDPSPLRAYYKPEYAGEGVLGAVESAEATLSVLLDLAEKEKRVIVLAVLPEDVYHRLSAELRSGLERFTLHIDLRDIQFLGEVVKAYSGCQGGFEKLVDLIEEYEGGYTLVAKYAGLTLRKKGCMVGDVQTALEEAKGKPKLFLAYYLWSVLLKGSEDFAKRVAVPLLLHAAFGPVPEGITYLTAATKERPWSFLKPSELEGERLTLQDIKEEELEPIAEWLSVWHEDLVEEMLKELCGFWDSFWGLRKREREPYVQQLPKLAGGARETGGKQGVLDQALDKVVQMSSIARAARGGEEPDPADALLEFAGRRLGAVLKAHLPECWRRLALMFGAALSDRPFKLLAEGARSSRARRCRSPCSRRNTTR